MINQHTDLYISASLNPGSFGATIFNHLFKIQNKNAIYIPRKITDSNELIKTIKFLSIKGCGVSSPLKSQVLSQLDKIDDLAVELNSVNTILNFKDMLTGFNTDWSGARSALEKKFATLARKPKAVRILGSGSVVRSIIFALKKMEISEIEVVYRNQSAAELLMIDFDIRIKPFADNIGWNNMDLLINAIPTIATENNEIFKRFVSLSALIFDLNVSPSDTPLIQIAKNSKIDFIAGVEMAKYQLIDQYFIYFGQKISDEMVTEVVQQHYLKV